ncbi:MAG: stage III sporulation protein AB [Oscillospiraceae bacterium]|nr:stage III sporulation protein AB [Oscillospiraceae bacterium]
MLKLFGLLLVAGGCTFWGFRAADELSARVRIVQELAQAVQVMERELSLFRPSLPVLLERMAQGRDKRVSDLLMRCCAEIEKGKNFTEIWEKQVEHLDIDEREKGLVRGLGQVLGQYDDRGQVQAAMGIRQELEACAARRREDNRTKGRMYRMLGVTAGGFLILTLV